MQDYKLKVILTVLCAIVFSMIFILLAFVMPVEKASVAKIEKTKRPESRLEHISESMKK